MPLIRCGRHSPEDLEAWARFERGVRLDAMARHRRIEALIRRSVDALHSFGDPAWVGVSWGKDSTVLAHLVALHRPELPLCWVITQHAENPDCWAVRDAFRGRFPRLTYREYSDGAEVIDGTLMWPSEKGWSTTRAGGHWPPVADYGERYVYGLRGEESRARRMRMWIHGLNSKRTCAPLGWWSAADVFAYLVLHDLPIHPAYACTRGGKLDPYWLRTAPLGGDRGTEHGRREWEWHYYEPEMLALGMSR